MANVTMWRYKVFEGNGYKNLMPELVRDGLAPLSVAESMTKVVKALVHKTKPDLELWLNRSLYTRDGVVFKKHEDLTQPRRFKLDLDSFLIRHINDPRVRLVEGGIPVSDRGYNGELTGPEFVIVYANGERFGVLAEKFEPERMYRQGEIYEVGGTAIGRPLGVIEAGGREIDEIEHSDLWLALSRYDFRKAPTDAANIAAIELRAKFRRAVFAEVKDRYSSNRAMGIELDDEPSSRTEETRKYNIMRALVLGNHTKRFSVIGNLDLDKMPAGFQLVGFAELLPETPQLLDDKVANA